MPSNPSSFLDDGTEVCVFCNKELPRYITKLLGKERDFGAKHCTCADAKSFWDDYERRIAAEVAAQEERERQNRIRSLFQQSMIPDRWRTRTFEHFTSIPQNEEAYQQAKAYADSFDPSLGAGLLFTGTVGTGKTHLAAAIALELLKREFSVVFGTVTTLLAQIRNTYSDDRESEQKVFNRLTKCQLLIIDDLGKEKVSEWTEQMMYEIINTRYENSRALVITTNLSLPAIRSKYPSNGDAIVDRILEMCQGVKMEGNSWRKKAIV